MWRMISEELMNRFSENKEIRDILGDVEEKVKNGSYTPSVAADYLLDVFLKSSKQK